MLSKPISLFSILSLVAILLLACGDADETPKGSTPPPTEVPWRVSSEPMNLDNVAQAQLIGRISIHQATVSRMAFSDDGRYLSTMSHGDRRVHAWDLQQGGAVVSVTGYDPVWTFFSADSQYFYLIDRQARITQWAIETGERIAEIESLSSGVGPLARAVDQDLVAIGGGQGNVFLFRLDPLEAVALVEAHPIISVTNVLLSADGETLVTQGSGGDIKIWDVESESLLHSFDTLGGVPQQLALNPLHNQLAIAFSNQIEFYNLDSYERESGFAIRQDAGSAFLQYSDDGSMLVMFGYDQFVELWDVQTGQLIIQLENGTSPVRSATLSNDNQLILVATRNQVFVWNLSTIAEEIPRGTIQLPPGNRVNVLLWSADNRLIAFANEIGSVFFYGIPDPNQPAPQEIDIEEDDGENDD